MSNPETKETLEEKAKKAQENILRNTRRHYQTIHKKHLEQLKSSSEEDSEEDIEREIYDALKIEDINKRKEALENLKTKIDESIKEGTEPPLYVKIFYQEYHYLKFIEQLSAYKENPLEEENVKKFVEYQNELITKVAYCDEKFHSYVTKSYTMAGLYLNLQKLQTEFESAKKRHHSVIPWHLSYEAATLNRKIREINQTLSAKEKTESRIFSSKWFNDKLLSLKEKGNAKIEFDTDKTPSLTRAGIDHIGNQIELLLQGDTEGGVESPSEAISQEDMLLYGLYFGRALFKKSMDRYGLKGDGSAEHPFTRDNMRAVLIGIAANMRPEDYSYMDPRARKHIQRLIDTAYHESELNQTRILGDFKNKRQNKINFDKLSKAEKAIIYLQLSANRIGAYLVKKFAKQHAENFGAATTFEVLLAISKPSNLCNENFLADLNFVRSQAKARQLSVEISQELSDLEKMITNEEISKEELFHLYPKLAGVQTDKLKAEFLQSSLNQVDLETASILNCLELGGEFCNFLSNYQSFKKGNLPKKEYVKIRNYFHIQREINRIIDAYSSKQGDGLHPAIKLDEETKEKLQSISDADVTKKQELRQLLYKKLTVKDVQLNLIVTALKASKNLKDFKNKIEEEGLGDLGFEINAAADAYFYNGNKNTEEFEYFLRNKLDKPPEQEKPEPADVREIIENRLKQAQFASRSEYMAHDLAYQDQYSRDGHLVALPDRDGKILDFEVQGIIRDEDGLGLAMYTPTIDTVLEKDGTIPLILNLPGTHDLASVLRDIHPVSAGLDEWRADRKYRDLIIEQLNAKITELRERYPENKIAIEIYGHSLGGGDTYNLELMIMEAMAQNAITDENKQQAIDGLQAEDDGNLTKKLQKGFAESLGKRKRDHGLGYTEDRKYQDKQKISAITLDNISFISRCSDRGAGMSSPVYYSRLALTSFLCRKGLQKKETNLHVKGDVLRYTGSHQGLPDATAHPELFKTSDGTSNLECIYVETDKGHGKKNFLSHLLIRGGFTSLEAHSVVCSAKLSEAIRLNQTIFSSSRLDGQKAKEKFNNMLGHEVNSPVSGNPICEYTAWKISKALLGGLAKSAIYIMLPIVIPIYYARSELSKATSPHKFDGEPIPGLKKSKEELRELNQANREHVTTHALGIYKEKKDDSVGIQVSPPPPSADL